MKILPIIFGVASAVNLIVFFFCLGRNMIVRKSVISWLLEEGTTKNEKIILSISFTLVLVFALLGVITANFF